MEVRGQRDASAALYSVLTEQTVRWDAQRLGVLRKGKSVAFSGIRTQDLLALG